MTIAVSHPDTLDDQQVAAVRALVDRQIAAEGTEPLSDQARTQLTSTKVRHALATGDAGDVVGYGQLDGDSLELVGTDPDALTALLDDLTGDGRDTLEIWTHGEHSALRTLLEARGGATATRELYQLRKPLDAAALPADPPLPADVTVRAFRPGSDDAAWLALNAAAFAHHPEQGRMTQADLDARMAEPWFDATGFLLAERDGDLVAFHWTKVHPDGLGEVYVLGVSPQAQGLGLGGALLTRGLRHLAGIGCATVLLYVDGDNPTAVHLYERDGFARYDLDVQWRMS